MPRSARLIDGKKIAAQIRAEVKAEVDALKKRGITPGLAVVLVGDDPASHVYVRGKARACEELGMLSFVHRLPANATERRVLNLVRKLNQDPKVHAFLVQSPLPKHMDENRVVTAIDPDKDADGFHPVNVGKLLIGEPAMMPCTPCGCQELLNRTGNSPEGKHVVIVGSPISSANRSRRSSSRRPGAPTPPSPSAIPARGISRPSRNRPTFWSRQWVCPSSSRDA